jgi:ATP-dependent exoDNAse (exonuclease V) beta subunit
VNRGRGFYDSREVNDLTHLMRIIANRAEISLAVVCVHPGQCSEEALLRLKMNGDTWEALANRPATYGNETTAARRFAAHLHEWRSAASTPFDRLLLSPRRLRAVLGYPISLAQARDAPRACRSMGS